jgi:hypothetical protein
MFNRLDFGTTLDQGSRSLHHFYVLNAGLNNGFIGKVNAAELDSMVHRSGM